MTLTIMAARLTLVSGLVAAALCAQSPNDGTREVLIWPPADPGIDALRQRAEAQRRVYAPALEVTADFAFEDRAVESGITFLHRVVEDAGKNYKMVHYDHGNGIAVADVDGDGRLDLYFTNQVGANELWRNLGGGRFEDWTERSGTGLAERISVAASFGDLDNDGDPDLYVTTVRQGNVLYENLGGGRFSERTAASGLGYTGHSSATTLFDYDNDGRLDILLTNVGLYTSNEQTSVGSYSGLPDAFRGHLFPWRTEVSRIYRNLGDLRFVDVSEQLGFDDSSWSGDATFIDFDRDGDLDLYLPNMQGDDHYWQNQAGTAFVERTEEYFPKTPWGTMGILARDVDNDARLDLILTDMHSDMSQEIAVEREHEKSDMQWEEEALQGSANNIFGNALFLQRADATFEEVSDRLATENYWPWGVSGGDLNADGWDDLFFTSSMNFPFKYHPNSALLNNAGKGFVPSEFLLGIEPRRGDRTHTPWFDLDCDEADRGHRMCVDRKGRFEVMGALGTRSSALIDLDDDGDLDIVTADFNSAPQVLISDLAQRHDVRWIKIELTGTASNRDGLGARVILHTDQGDRLQQVDGKSGYLSQSSIPLYFGLGTAKIESIEVQWPSGVTQTITEGLEAGQTLPLVEPSP